MIICRSQAIHGISCFPFRRSIVQAIRVTAPAGYEWDFEQVDFRLAAWFSWCISMDWFKGKLKPESPTFNGEIYGFRLRFPLKPIH